MCGKKKDDESFAWKRKGERRQSHCRDCQRGYRRKHYEENRQKYLDKAESWRRDRREELRAMVLEHLTQHPCVDCGTADVRVLDFDHVTGVKKFGIAEGITDQVNPQVLRDEIEKCVVRCANCHRIKTGDDLGWWKSTR